MRFFTVPSLSAATLEISMSLSSPPMTSPPNVLSADLKVALYRRTGLSADVFDVQVINDIIDSSDLFGLIFLKNLFSNNILIVDRLPDVKGAFLERYGRKFRECEGLISETLS